MKTKPESNEVPDCVLVEPYIYQKEDGFYFINETQSDLEGPYKSIALAREGMHYYGLWLDTGEERVPLFKEQI